ncbi:TetR/AcrR family transcriptional regulator [Streptomyces sp. NPDC051636]|uniref:TetR/AcrR family transcriptional regulator n=1 Tax=Streptomyces sp. NPDC051636 TaxID=3365663 RepID=UPI00379ADA03
MRQAPDPDRGVRSRDAILDTATELMSVHGYAATSISMVSAACSLPASSIYWHFGSKDGVYVAVLERARMSLLSALPPVTVPGADIGQRLDNFLQAVGDAFQRHPRDVKLLIALGMLQRTASAAALAELHRYRDALLAWARDSLTSVFRLHDRPEVSGQLARFALRAASGTAVARWFDPASTLDTDALRVALLALAAHHGVPLGASASEPAHGRQSSG